MNPAIYVITNYHFNHNLQNPRIAPLDPRFLRSKRNFIYYLIDKTPPPELMDHPFLIESQIDETLYKAGGEHLAEWSFLLAEEKHQFCSYPFFMVSSRFYEKNRWLKKNLDEEWEELFSFFDHYRYGFLPSYDRPLRWIDINWKKKLTEKRTRSTFFPWKEELFHLSHQLFGVKIPEEYAKVSDFQCNYIGFRDRQALLEYVAFYKPLIHHFFDEHYTLIRSLEPYVKKTGTFKNEKPFTFWLEILSHLFFYAKQEKIFALHYDGYQEIDEYRQNYRRLTYEPLPWLMQSERSLRWFYRYLKTEGILAPLYNKASQ